MSAGFRAVQWNRAKLVYDGILLAGVTLYIGTYILLSVWLDPPKDEPAAIDIRIRAFGTCAFFMLTIILSIGPLARFDRRFLPLLYNRRHFGVLTFFVALLHASFMIEWFAVQNALPSLYDKLTKASDYAKFIGFSVQGAGAGRAADLVRDGGDQPRFLAGLPNAAGLEEPAHGALPRLRAGGDACGARRHAIRPQPGHSGDAGRGISLRDDTAPRCRLARACR